MGKEKKPDEQQAVPDDDNVLPTPSFPDINPPEHLQADGETDDTTDDEPDEITQRLEALEAQREAERQEFSEREQRLYNTINRLIQNPSQQQQAGGNEADQLGEPPDPVEKPQEFQSWLSKRDESLLKQAQTHSDRTTQQMQVQQRRQQAWSEFNTRYQDLSEFPAEVQYAVNVEAQELGKQGMGIDDALAQEPDKFYDRVARRARGYMEEKGLKPGDKGGDETNKNNQATRTAGVSAGTKGGTNKPSNKDSVKPFHKALLEQQQKDGLI